MSDIRDRIAAVLLSPAGLEGSGYPPGTLGHHRRLDEAHRLADVLIRELGLRREERSLADGMGGVSTNYRTGVTTTHFKPCTRQHRYFTAWTADA